MVYLDHITCLRYAIPVRNPHNKTPKTCVTPTQDSPSVVLCIEEEVGADDGDADSDDGEDDEHKQHEAIHIVDLVGPERREDEIPAKHTDPLANKDMSNTPMHYHKKILVFQTWENQAVQHKLQNWWASISTSTIRVCSMLLLPALHSRSISRICITLLAHFSLVL